MGYGGIVTGVVLATVAQMPAQFSTRDVSDHPTMLATHPEPRHSHYHAFVGKELKVLCDGRGQLVLEEIRKQTARGSVWRKRDAEPSNHHARVATTAAPDDAGDRVGIGPQYSGDKPFTRAMRLHQSRYRAEVLRAPYGTGPEVTSAAHYGNMLTVEDGKRGLNFLTPQIYEIARRRVSRATGMVAEFRLYCNMLSSQPMCFNLFGPLVDDLDLATTLWKKLLPGEVERVTRVEIEWNPEPRFEYLDDRTAFDAFVEYERPDGTSAFVGIETKLTEPFSQKHYDNEAYRRWMRVDDTPWKPEAWNRVDDDVHNQLWRDHLLAVAVRRHASSKYTHGRFMLVRHGGDTECARVVVGYRELLRDGDDTFIDMPLDRLVAEWIAVASESHRDWLERFRARYLDL
ncbi:MAG: hypothetical protein IT350_09890 [Deltaproteobacteria bacterium]|nr:hypothetical protein [Deltaproteobacteria bacterium]